MKENDNQNKSIFGAVQGFQGPNMLQGLSMGSTTFTPISQDTNSGTVQPVVTPVAAPSIDPRIDAQPFLTYKGNVVKTDSLDIKGPKEQ